MVGQILLLALASFLGSGILFAHRRILTYLAVSGVLFEAQWLFLTLFDRALFRNIETELVFMVGSIFLLALWILPHFAKASRGLRFASRLEQWNWQKETAILVPTIIVLAAAFVIFEFNTFSLFNWKTHGFFNGDTATLIAITQKAFLTNGLVEENPFAGNGSLEYPTLLHSGLATFFYENGEGAGMDWYRFLPFLTYLQIVLTVPMFFLLGDAIYPEPVEGWKTWFGVPSRWAIHLLQGALVLYVMTLSWESYVYPQGHFFLMGMFLLMVALLAKSWGGSVRQTYPKLGVAVVIGLVLLFSNAVTGTAAVLLKVIYDGLHVIKRGQAPAARLEWAVGVLFWIVLFFLFMPGNGSLGWIPSFSYTAAHELGRLAPILILVGMGMWLTYERKLFVGMAALGLSALALVTFVFSTRDIVIENASRFFYHAVLVAFPLALPPLIRGYYWFKREFMYSSRSGIEKVVGWGTVVVLLAVFLLPAGASVASTHDNLMFKDEQTVTPGMHEAAIWIFENTSSDAVFLTPPEPPFWVSVLTGRAILRSDFWLSPDDRLLADVKAAFQGNVAAQEQAAQAAEYLVLGDEDRTAWEPLARESIFDGAGITIYPLR